MAKKVFLSPSDHGVGNNRCLHSGCYEDKHTKPIAEVCAKHLENSGIEVKIGTPNQTLSQRCNDSNNFGADLHVPIHTNAWSDPEMRYLMFMFYDDTAKYRKVFDTIAPELEAVYPGHGKSKFAVRKDLWEITKPYAVSIYCELGFHTNQKDCDEFIHDPEVVGAALAKGICKYLGVEYVPPKAEEKPVATNTTANSIYRVFNAAGKQVGAYSVEANAFAAVKKQLQNGGSAKITYGPK